MASYRSYGGLDDQSLIDGDTGFVGINQRLQLNQLQAGEIRESLNGRIEGYWKPRKGIVEKTSAFTTGSTPLQLPFYLIDSPKTISAATVPVTGTIRITVTAHGFEDGSTGWATIAGLDTAVSGSYLLTYYDANTLEYTVAGITSVTDGTGTLSQMHINDTANANVRASCLFSDPNTGNKEYVIVALDTIAKKIDLDENNVGANGYLSTTDIPYPPGLALGSATEMIQVFDKVMLFRDGQQAFEWYPNGRPVLSASQAGTTTVTMSLREHGLLAGTSITIAGLTGGTPANGTFTVSTVVDKDTFQYVFDSIIVSGTLSPDVTGIYPKGNGLINSRSYWKSDTLIQTGPAVISGSNPQFSGVGTLIYYDGFGGRWIMKHKTSSASSATFQRQWISSPTSTFDIFAATGWAASSPATGVPSFANTSQTVTFGVSSATVSDGFTLSPGGTYTQPQTFNITAKDVDVVGGLVTATVVGNTTIRAGDVIVVRQTATPELDTMLGKEYYVTEATTTTIKWYAPVGDYNTSSSDDFEFGGQFSVGGGFMHQPGAPWGVYFQRRLWVPHYYTVSGTYSAPVYTSTKITDEIAVSDILDTTTFDQIENQFRISGGTADYVVGMHGFYEDKLIVLNRNSLHQIKGTQGSLLDTEVTELTSEVGCLARKTIVSRGNMIMFLSDDGVYAVEFLNDYNLRGAEEPISKNIQPYIDRINKDYVDRSVGILFNNRYYLAVPLDSAEGADDARGNNAVLVFNFLNKAWESLDTFGDSRFLIENFVIGSAGVRNNIYAVTSNGGLHQFEAVNSSIDRLNVSNTENLVLTPTVNSSLTTRGYDFNTMDRKRFTDTQLVMQNLAGEQGEYSISFAAEDPDTAQFIGTTTEFLGGEVLSPSTTGEAETAGIRCRLGGIRGYTGTMILTRTLGSPKVNSIKVAGSITNRQIISQK